MKVFILLCLLFLGGLYVFLAYENSSKEPLVVADVCISLPTFFTKEKKADVINVVKKRLEFITDEPVGVKNDGSRVFFSYMKRKSWDDSRILYLENSLLFDFSIIVYQVMEEDNDQTDYVVTEMMSTDQVREWTLSSINVNPLLALGYFDFESVNMELRKVNSAPQGGAGWQTVSDRPVLMCCLKRKDIVLERSQMFVEMGGVFTQWVGVSNQSMNMREFEIKLPDDFWGKVLTMQFK